MRIYRRQIWRGLLRETSQGDFSGELFGGTLRGNFSEGPLRGTFPSGRPVNHQ